MQPAHMPLQAALVQPPGTYPMEVKQLMRKPPPAYSSGIACLRNNLHDSLIHVVVRIGEESDPSLKQLLKARLRIGDLSPEDFIGQVGKPAVTASVTADEIAGLVDGPDLVRGE